MQIKQMRKVTIEALMQVVRDQQQALRKRRSQRAWQKLVSAQREILRRSAA
jgi:hypothetical protein